MGFVIQGLECQAKQSNLIIKLIQEGANFVIRKQK